MSNLREYGGLDLYLATPYSRDPLGLEHAFIEACRLCGALLRRGLTVYSPIAHTHPIAVHAGIDPLDLAIWLPFNAVRIAKADALLVAMMPGWNESSGVAHEIAAFQQADKPVFYLDPDALELR